MRYAHTLALLLSLLAAALPWAASAQSLSNPQAQLSDHVDAPKGPQLIPVGDIPWRADADERFVTDVIARATRRDPLAAFGPRLLALRKSVDEKTRVFQYDELRTLPILRLESLERHWNFDARQYARWRSDLRAATEPLADDASELAHRRGDWELTRSTYPRGSLPDALSDRIDAVLGHLKGAEQSLSKPLARQIELGRQANALDTRIEAGRATVTAAIDYIDKRLLKMDSPPIWAVQSSAAQGNSTVKALTQGFELEASFARQYNAADVGNQRLLSVLRYVLLPLLLWMAYRERRRIAAVPREPSAQRVLRRPISAWLLLSMVGVLVLEPNAPLIVHQLAMAVALIPVLRLLPVEGSRLLGPWPYAATVFYLLERLGFFLLADALAYRWYYLILALLCLSTTVWLLWRARHRLHHSLPEKLVRAIAWLTVALLLVSLVCNVVGNASMAEMLTSGIIDSGYLALVIYATVNVFNTLLHLLFGWLARTPLRVMHRHAGALLRLCMRVLMGAAIIGWLAFTLNRFRVFRPLYAWLQSVVTHRIEYGELSISLGHILVFGLAVFLTYWVANAVRLLLKEEVLTRMALPRGVDNSIASLSYYALLLLGLLAALSAAGLKVGQLTFLFGALGVGIGLGLQDVVKNFVSGLILMFERPVKPGDVVDISGTVGRVRDIGMRATTVKTFEGADVVVPNGMLLSDKLTNWTLMDRNRRLDLEVGVAYGSDVAQVMQLLERATRDTQGVSNDPAPTVLFSSLGASALNFSVRAWTREFDDWVGIRSQLLARIYADLQAAGVEIPYPQQDVHVRTVSAEVLATLRSPAAADKDVGGGAPGSLPAAD